MYLFTFNSLYICIILKLARNYFRFWWLVAIQCPNDSYIWGWIFTVNNVCFIMVILTYNLLECSLRSTSRLLRVPWWPPKHRWWSSQRSLSEGSCNLTQGETEKEVPLWETFHSPHNKHNEQPEPSQSYNVPAKVPFKFSCLHNVGGEKGYLFVHHWVSEIFQVSELVCCCV